MATLDSLSRQDLLVTLKEMIDLKTWIGEFDQNEYQIGGLANAYNQVPKRSAVTFLGWFFLIYAVIGSIITVVDKQPLSSAVVPAGGAIWALLFFGIGWHRRKGFKSRKNDLEAQLSRAKADSEANRPNYEKARARLEWLFSSYQVRSDLRDLDALRFCYSEIYASSLININTAFDYYVAMLDRRAAAAAHNEQVAAMERAREEAQHQHYLQLYSDHLTRKQLRG